MLSSVEIYDPVANTWTVLPAMGRPRRDHTASLLPDGSVLVAGGTDISGVPTNQAELLDSHAVGWQPLQPMRTRRRAHTAAALPNGRVVVAGGTGLNSHRPLKYVRSLDAQGKSG